MTIDLFMDDGVTSLGHADIPDAKTYPKIVVIEEFISHEYRPSTIVQNFFSNVVGNKYIQVKDLVYSHRK